MIIKEQVSIPDEQIKELTEVLRICEASNGFYGARLVKIMIEYFKKFFDVNTEYSHGFINSEKCFIKKRNSEEVICSIKDIRDKMVHENILQELRLHAEDKFGNKIWIDSKKNIPAFCTMYKIKNKAK